MLTRLYMILYDYDSQIVQGLTDWTSFVQSLDSLLFAIFAIANHPLFQALSTMWHTYAQRDINKSHNDDNDDIFCYQTYLRFFSATKRILRLQMFYSRKLP